MKDQKGSRNSRWKGGVQVCPNGYLRITSGPCRGQYVHRLIAQAKIGRPLREDEEAHHIDHDPGNPHPDNIEVVPKVWNRQEGIEYRNYGCKEARGGIFEYPTEEG